MSQITRSCGVLLHITSLPSPYGIGTLGKFAREFVDFLVKGGQTFWQILPLGTTGYGDSPYQSFSAFAGNHYLIDIDYLIEDKLLTANQVSETFFELKNNLGFVDYSKIYTLKNKILKDAYKNFKETPEYCLFCGNNAFWLNDYAFFSALNVKYDYKFPENIMKQEATVLSEEQKQLADEIDFWKFTQYTFFNQWTSLKKYANSKGIKIIGDAPIYCAKHSADVWANPLLFQLDEDREPTFVAGVPPDYFSETGQLWGNPLYDWEYHKKTDFKWWSRRLKFLGEIYDYTRIDHFRAFDTYYSIPNGEKTAINGKWEVGPGIALWKSIEKSTGKQNIIAEDLGEIFDSVKELLEETGFPGMRVLQFGFNPQHDDNIHLPHNYPQNSVAYTGTHDNDTSLGWFKSIDKKTKKMLSDYLGEPYSNNRFIETLFGSPSNITIVPFQDYVNLDSKARFNTPGTTSVSNWSWRLKKMPAKTISDYMRKLAYAYFRLNDG